MVHIRRTTVLRSAVLLLLGIPAPALAQPQRPIGPYVADIRGLFVRYKDEPSVANDLGVVPANLPPRSFGLGGGVHWYPWRLSKITFGVGGEFLSTHGSHSVEPTTPTDPPSPVVRRHFSEFSPQLSFNFGHRNGWSYISGGIGRSTLYADREDAPVSDATGRKTINYGAGARWFTNHHVAFAVEIRWYSVSPQSPTAGGGVAQPRTTLMVLSAGVALR
jgi:outer membrane protein with beta-barrel domain